MKETIEEKVKWAIENTPKELPEGACIACQGTEGANSQLACERVFKNPTILFFSSFEAVFSAVQNGLCQYGVIPVENSTAGSVNAVYDLMLNYKFSIVRSVRMKIEHNLLVKPGTKMEDIREIYTHEQAINQCSKFIGSLKDVRVIPLENTAVGAKMVAESDRTDIAAIASKACMKYYDLKNLKQGIQDNDNNYTRFICISKNLEIYPGADRSSLMVTLEHEPGSLYKALSILNDQGINLLKLESRPIPNREFEFKFYFDIETSVYSSGLTNVLGNMPAVCDEFRYLGSYSEII